MRLRESADVSLVFWPLLWNIHRCTWEMSCTSAHKYLRLVECVRKRGEVLQRVVVYAGR